MVIDTIKKENTLKRLQELLLLQKELESRYGSENYNVFVFGSYLTTSYVEGKSDIDIAIYSQDFNLYKKLSAYLEEYFLNRKIKSDIFYIDLSMEAPVYCAPLTSRVQFTDYFPQELQEFLIRCQNSLAKLKERVAV